MARCGVTVQVSGLCLFAWISGEGTGRMTESAWCPAEDFTHLLDSALLVLLFKYEVLQLQVDI